MPTTTASPRHLGYFALVLSLLAIGCSDDEKEKEPSAFALSFQARAGDAAVGCDDELDGLGPNEDVAVGVSDLRFYVSALAFADAAGKPLDVSLDENDFQYTGKSGSVALIDLTGNDAGSCAAGALGFGEGTARTNDAITGRTLVDDVASISFEVGVPQALMREVIAENSAEGAPSPLNELQWTWASGYRHLVLNFTIRSRDDVEGEGYLHVGSRDCGPMDGLALEDREECGFVNTPKVALSGFDLSQSKVTLDVARLLAGLDFVSAIRDPETSEVVGEGPGAACHSAPSQPDCGPLFENLGLDAADGTATASRDDVFGVE